MKIIDWERKGNVVRFYLGKDDLEEWWGDDWDDRPYEHNAGTVYDEFVTGTVDIAFSFDLDVFEPKDDCIYRGNSPYRKKDFMQKDAPILVIASSDDYWDARYSICIGSKNVFKVYMGDPIPTNIDGLVELNRHITE